MKQELIFIPFFGMMLLTIVVWLYMYYVRLRYIYRNKIKPQSLSTYQQAADIIPDKVNVAAENLNNLFEVPVLFYGTCLYLFVTNNVNSIYLSLATAFLFIRIIHSAIHCSHNIVTYRFYAHIASSFILWSMITIAILGLLKNINI